MTCWSKKKKCAFRNGIRFIFFFFCMDTWKNETGLHEIVHDNVTNTARWNLVECIASRVEHVHNIDTYSLYTRNHILL